MADLQRTIEILFTGSENVGQTTQSVGRHLSDLEGKVGSVTGPMADWTKNLLAAEGALVGVGLAMAGVAVSQAGEFKTSVQEIGTLFGGTQEQVKGLQDEILNYATASTASITEINGAVYQAISTGTNYADAVKYVADAEVLATAGRADLVQVTDLLASSMNAYGAEVGQASDYTDVLLTTVQQGKTTLPELASNLGKVTGIASAAQVPFDDLNAALAALTIYTGNTAESSTKLKALLTELLKPSDELSAALGGVSLQGDGLDGVMRKLKEATGGNAASMVQLFGSTEAVQAALALANDSAGNYNNALQAMDQRTGVAAAANDVLGQSFESLNQNLLNTIQTSFINAGDPLLDEYGAVVSELSNLFKTVSFEFKGGAFDALYDGVEDASEAITSTLRGIAEALPEALENIDYSGLLGAFGKLGDSVSSLFGDLDLTKPEDLAQVIQTLVDGVDTLTRFTAGAVEGLRPFVQALFEIMEQATKTDDGVADLVGQVLGFATGLDAVLPLVGGLGSGLSTLGGTLAVLGGARQLGLATGGIQGMAGALLNPATGLIAAIGFTAYALGDFALMVAETNEKLEQYRQEDERWAKASAMADSWGDMIIKAKELGSDVSHLADAFEDTYGITIEQASGYDTVADAMEGVAQASRDAAAAEREQADIRSRANTEAQIAALNERTRIEQQEELKRTTLEQVAAYRELTAEQYNQLTVAEREQYLNALLLADKEGWVQAIDDESDARKKLTDQQKEQEDALKREAELRKEAADQLFRQTQQTLDFQLALEKLASDERLQMMEFSFELDIERLRQDGQTARSIIEGIGTTITSTGETLVGLAGALGNVSGYSALTLRNEIEAESKRRDEALVLQKEMTAAQIEQMEAQTRMMEARAEALERGDAAITIQGDGLQPHLEAFMWEIVQAVQVRVNAEGMDMLLGTDAGGGA